MSKTEKTQLIALRELQKRGKVEFKVGDPVPPDAYPSHQMNALLSNGGLRRTLVVAVPPKKAEPEPEKPIPAEVAGMHESPHDTPAADAPAKPKSRKAKAD